MDERASVALIEALAGVWSSIRARHPDVPGVVLLPAPSLTRKMNVLGHFAPLRWRPKQREGALVHEVVVVAEHLDRTAADIAETLLHEAAHALNFSRGIRDCSRSQYHNREFKAAAEEVGLEVAQVPHYGYALTGLPQETAAAYHAEIAALEAVLVHRLKRVNLPPRPPGPGTTPPGAGDGTGAPSTRSRKATCPCGYIIRVAKKTMDKTVIRCENCGEPFALV